MNRVVVRVSGPIVLLCRARLLLFICFDLLYTQGTISVLFTCMYVHVVVFQHTKMCLFKKKIKVILMTYL